MPSRTSNKAHRGLGGLCAALALALGWSLLHAERSEDPRESNAPDVVGLPSAGTWDSHPDPDVGRVLQPRLVHRKHTADYINTNSWGVREREWGPKAPGVVRIVALGDSYVMGMGVDVEERFGPVLERFIEERAGASIDVEAFHVAVSSWNLLAECAFMRRTLDVLSPDLVIHVPNRNDLSDMNAVRGSGKKSEHSAQVSERGSGIVETSIRVAEGSPLVNNYLPYGLCWEARERYTRAAEDVERLAAAVRMSGSSYLMLPCWTGLQPLVARHFGPVLWKNELSQLPDTLLLDNRTWVASDERHWNQPTHEKLAKLLYGLIQQRDLLPSLELPAWDEADAVVDALHKQGTQEARRMGQLQKKIAELGLTHEIVFRHLDEESVKQVYGGVHPFPGKGPPRHLAAPYVSLLFPGGEVSELTVRALRAGRPELTGRTRVYVEEFEVGSWDLVGPRELDERFALPKEVVGRPFLNVRLVSDDYLYAWPRICVSFELTSVAVL